MSFRDRMKRKKGGLKKRHNEQQKDTGGGRYPTIFLRDKIPEGVEFYKCKEGEHMVDIIPWMAGANMPLDESNRPVTEEGELDYVLDVYVHQNMGKLNNPYVCQYENFGEPCPACEYIKANRLEKKLWSKLRAKRRVIYLVWDHQTREGEKKGIQIFEAAHFFMEEKISEIAKLPKGGGSIIFSDPDDGKTLCWTRKGSGQENTQYLGHKLVDRDSPIPDKILDKGFALDSIIKMHFGYDVFEKDFKDTLKNLGLLDESADEPEAGDEPFGSGHDDDDVPEIKDEEKKKSDRPTGKRKKKRKRV